VGTGDMADRSSPSVQHSHDVGFGMYLQMSQSLTDTDQVSASHNQNLILMYTTKDGMIKMM